MIDLKTHISRLVKSQQRELVLRLGIDMSEINFDASRANIADQIIAACDKEKAQRASKILQEMLS